MVRILTSKRLMACAIVLVALGGFLWLTADYSSLRVYSRSDASKGIRVEDVALQHSGQVLRGVVMRAEESAVAVSRPGVLLLHGTNPRGRRLLLYEVLAIELVKHGAVVLVYDQRGYGDSPDPVKNSDGTYDLDFIGDALRAVEFLKEQPGVDGKNLIVAGHSFGGSVAIGVSHQPRIGDLVRKIVIMSPGRGWPYSGDERFVFRSERISRDMRLKSKIQLDNIRDVYSKMEVESLYKRESTVNLVLINGEYEEIIKPLGDAYLRISWPKELHIIAKSDHYFGARPWINRFVDGVSFYHAENVIALASLILAP